MTRLMPERWFYGSAGQWLISGLDVVPGDPLRPLAPGERALGRFILPPFQRPPVWTQDQKEALIESIYIGMPIGAIVWNQTRFDAPTDRWLLDGQQRVTAILGFLAGEVAVRGHRYPDLPEIDQRHFRRIGIPVVETSIDSPVLCREVYERLVYGGTPHDPE